MGDRELLHDRSRKPDFEQSGQATNQLDAGSRNSTFLFVELQLGRTVRLACYTLSLPWQPQQLRQIIYFGS